MKKILLVLVLVVLLAAVGFAAWRTLQLPAPQKPSGATAALITVDRAGVATRLAGALRFATIAAAPTAPAENPAFAALRDYLREQFPKVHQQLQVEVIGQSLLYTWTGSQPALPPALLAAHLDVVPAAAEGWTHPPFDGVIADGFIWGRGAMDDKNSALAILEATEALLQLGVTPPRTHFLAFGADEEIGGAHGAKAIAALLKERGVKLAFSLDEGGVVSSGIVPGVKRPVATIMAGEKGFLSVRLRLVAPGGHSSTPPPRTVVGRLARAIARLEDHPMPKRLVAPIDAMLAGLAPEMDWPTRIVVANRDWLQPLLFMALERSPTTNALIRTTTAPTIFQAGVKDNVLPGTGEAVVNFRLLPGDSIASVLAHVRTTIDDEAITIEPLPGFNNEAPPASDVSAPPFKLIARAVHDVFPEALVASGLVIGATDNRHYAQVREQGYHFSPMPYTPSDQGRVHGINERIAVADYVRMIQFYAQLMREGAPPP